MGIFDAFLVHSCFLFPGTVSLRYTTTANSQLPPNRPHNSKQPASRTSRSQNVKGAFYAGRAAIQDMRVDHSRFYIGVAEQLLDRTDIVTRFQ